MKAGKKSSPYNELADDEFLKHTIIHTHKLQLTRHPTIWNVRNRNRVINRHFSARCSCTSHTNSIFPCSWGSDIHAPHFHISSSCGWLHDGFAWNCLVLLWFWQCTLSVIFNGFLFAVRLYCRSTKITNDVAGRIHSGLNYHIIVKPHAIAKHLASTFLLTAALLLHRMADFRKDLRYGNNILTKTCLEKSIQSKLWLEF